VSLNALPFDPTVNRDHVDNCLAYLCALKTSRIGVFTNLRKNAVPAAPDLLCQESLDHIQARISHLLALLQQVVRALIELVTLNIQLDGLYPPGIALPSAIRFWTFRNDLLDIGSHGFT
jgi:hypothetical protein